MHRPSEVAIAVETLDELYGHHTAHLTPGEQLHVALWLARRCTETAEDIVKNEFVERTEAR